MNTNKVILKPLFQKKADPLTLLLKDIFKDNRNAMSYLGALSIGLGFSQTDSAFAEEDVEVEEVIVTASKRETNLQDLPMAVQAITSEELDKILHETIQEHGFKSIKDLGKLLGFLKSKYPGQLDMQIVAEKAKKNLRC